LGEIDTAAQVSACAVAISPISAVRRCNFLRYYQIGFTPAGKMEQFFRDLEKRGRYFGSGTAEDRETLRREYGIVNAGPPITV
jgi:hypothetical protein